MLDPEYRAKVARVALLGYGSFGAGAIVMAEEAEVNADTSLLSMGASRLPRWQRWLGNHSDLLSHW
eukprot:3539893-Amphidinium_carterae.1